MPRKNNFAYPTHILQTDALTRVEHQFGFAEINMTISTPIGSICPFAGQVDPISGTANSIWTNMACTGGSPDKPTAASASVNRLEAQGWMLCDGRYLSTTAYPELYAVLGNLYGSKISGSDSLFAIPDYRGLFLRGFDSGAGMDPDAANRTDPTGNHVANTVGSLQCDAFQKHTHNYSITQQLATPAESGNAASVTSTSTATTDPNGPARTTSETRPKNVAVNYIIKFR